MVGDDDTGTADLDSALGIGRGHNAFEAELAVPLPHHLSHIVPVHGWIEHLRKVAADRERAAAHIDVLVELGQSEPLVGEIVDCPHRLYRELQHPCDGQFEWNRKSSA